MKIKAQRIRDARAFTTYAMYVVNALASRILCALIFIMAFGWFLVCSSCARDVGLLFWFCLPTPGCGVLLGCFVGCARMWVLGLLFSFFWLFVLVEPVCG